MPFFDIAKLKKIPINKLLKGIFITILGIQIANIYLFIFKFNIFYTLAMK